MIITKYTNGVKVAAIFSWFGPVRIDAGIISPNNSTAVTERMMASSSSTMPLRNIGRASVAEAFLFFHVIIEKLR